jgi:hypothetical protein
MITRKVFIAPILHSFLAKMSKETTSYSYICMVITYVIHGDNNKREITNLEVYNWIISFVDSCRIIR